MPIGTRGGAAILAGGRSSRMGRDKALLEIDGRRLLDRCADALRPIASPIIVVADTPDRFSLPAYRTVADLYPGAGPVGAIVTALLALGEGWHLIVACDMPFLKTELLQLLVSRAGDDFDAIVPRIEDRPEPLCALYRQTCVGPLQAFLKGGERPAAHRALRAVRTRYVEEPDLRGADPHLLSFVNLNTPEDARQWTAEDPL
jgi:molybdenum cofactor guanylyltransferase